MKKIVSIILFGCVLWIPYSLGAAEYVPNELIIKFKPAQAITSQKSYSFMQVHSQRELPIQVQQVFKLLKINQVKNQFSRPEYPRQTLIRSFTNTKQSQLEQHRFRRKLRYYQFFQDEGLDRVFRIRLDPVEQLDQVLEQLKKQPEVEWVQKNYYVKSFVTVPNDTQYGSQYALPKISLPHQDGSPGLDGAWDITTGSATTVVAVIDSGLDLTNDDFTGRLWVNSGETAGNGIDDDLNGKIDDVNGWNFVSNTNNVQDDNDQDASTGCSSSPIYHGTHVAGVIGANGNNSNKIAGVDWNAKLMPLKVMNRCGIGTNADIAEAINYAASQGADVINLSLGGTYNDPSVQAAVATAYSAGVVIVAAMGNSGDGTIYYPAGYSQVIGVGATDSSDNLTSFSTYGSGSQTTELVAPGSLILSTTYPNTTSTLSGTSFSSPYVAGLASLILASEPTLNADQVRYRLQTTSDDLGASGYDVLYGYGRINANNALNNKTFDSSSTSGQINQLKNYPNPITGSQTVFSFVLRNPAQITIRIFNLSGRLLHTIRLGQRTSGQTQSYSWDLTNAKNQTFGNGTYIYQIESIESDGTQSTQIKRFSISR